MTNKEIWTSEVRDVFKKIKSHKKPYSTKLGGIEIDIFPNVFSPMYFTDSEWFAKSISKIVGNKTLLEIGTGTGVVSLIAGINGANISVTDINPDAIKNAKHNFSKYNIKAKTYCGNMYEPLESDVKFDFIFWNHPFNCGDNPDEDILLKAGFDFNYESLESYISGAKKHLNHSGRLLLGTGGCADLDKIKKIANRYGYKMKLLGETNIPLTKGSSVKNNYRIYQFI